VPLDNPVLGWLFRPKSVPYTALERDLEQVDVRGWDGNVPTPSSFAAGYMPLQVNTPPGSFEALQALFRGALVLTRDDRAGVEASARLATSSIDRVFPRNEWIDVTYVVEIPGVFWRDVAETTAIKSIAAASVAVPVFPGMSAPVHDAVIRIKGAATGIQVTDSSGAWVTLPNAAAGEWVRFDSLTGQCFKTTTDTWSGGTDVSGQVDFGGPRDVFEITPVLAPLNPTSRAGALTVTTATRSGAVIDVRGKSAYVL
jgi:hypothetical protein